MCEQSRHLILSFEAGWLAVARWQRANQTSKNNLKSQIPVYFVRFFA